MKLKIIVILMLLVIYLGMWHIVLNIPPTQLNYDVIEIQVQPGDTAWKLVTDVNQNGDIRELIHEFRNLNGSVDLQVGQLAQVPIIIP